MLRRLFLVTLCWLGCAGVGTAAQLGSGDVFPPTTLPDQHGDSAMIGADAALVLFAAGKVATELLNGFLTRHAAVYAVDDHAPVRTTGNAQATVSDPARQ